jgi:hypothetical protein
MVDFRSGYVPPGVYVSADTSSVATAVGISPTVVCLIGPGLGYQTFSETLTFANNTANVVLTQLGIQQNSVVVKSPDGSTTYTATTDYTLSSSHASLPDAVTTIAIVSSGNIDAGDPVVVSYNFANTGYFGLNQFGDFASLINVYGSPFNATTGQVQSPLSLAAQIAFENGANQIYAVTLNGLGSLSDQFNAAYALTATNFNIDLVVPIFADGTIADDTAMSPYTAGLVAHLQSTEDAGYPRVALVGVPSDFSTAITPDIIASQLDYRRVSLIWPNQYTYYNSVLNTTVTISGVYAAAAAAGVLANQPINTGLTRRQLRSLTAIAPAALLTETTANKDYWSSKGVAVVEPNRQNQLIVRHGVTTDMSSITNRELSIVRCQDALFTIVQQSLDQAELIGSPITLNTPLAVKGIITGALETALGSDTIQGYDNVSVRQQILPSGDPTIIECLFSYAPTYPMNYITVKFSLDLSTGSITTTTDSAGTTTS